ncbi:MAG: hypothetical protein ACLQCB_22325 [Spirochaetia bacterium]
MVKFIAIPISIASGFALAVLLYFAVVLPGLDGAAKQLKSDLALATEQLSVSNRAATASAAAATAATADAASAKQQALASAASAAAAVDDARTSRAAFDSLLADNRRLQQQLGQAGDTGATVAGITAQLGSDSDRAKQLYQQWATGLK